MLPEGLVIEVLLRLPVKTIIHCKCVCKTWRGIISDPYFVNLHMSTPRESLLIHHYTTDVPKRLNGPGILKWVEQMEHEAGFHIDHVSSLDLTRCAPHATFQLCRLGSVNGLVSCGDLNYDIIYILNPLLNEYMALPRPKKAMETLGYGFGVSSEDEYKVVRISCGEESGDQLDYYNSFETEVYTLGIDKWKSLGLTPYNFSLSKPPSDGLYFNSHLYWQLVKDQIYDFDLTTETFDLFPSPPVHTGLNKKLGVLKGRICCIAWWSWSAGLDIWVMKEGSWYKEISYQIMSPFYITSSFYAGSWTPTCVINGLKGTSNLLVYDHSKNQLVACCLDKDTVLPLKLQGYLSKIIRYHPTFLSLHNYGSASVRAM